MTFIQVCCNRTRNHIFWTERGVNHDRGQEKDVFLDAINLMARELHQLTTSINDLVEVVRINFCYITPDEAEELLELSDPINKKMQLLYKKLLKLLFYIGMETVVKLYENAMSDFDELCHDLKCFRINLERNEEFKATLNRLNGCSSSCLPQAWS